MKHTFGERSICRRCDLEIEFHGKRTWFDRGGNKTCAKDGRKHQPNWPCGLEPLSQEESDRLVYGMWSNHDAL